MRPQLGVATGRQPMAATLKLVLKLGILEQLAVLRDPDRAILVADRLSAPRQVHDRQTTRAQRHSRLDMNLLVVRSRDGRSRRSSPIAGRRKTHADRSDRSHPRCHTSQNGLQETEPLPPPILRDTNLWAGGLRWRRKTRSTITRPVNGGTRDRGPSKPAAAAAFRIALWLPVAI